jgi:predicted nuclease of predicted toxin-antitoxin system
VRFLIDENLSPKICSRLNAVGHEAHHVREVGLAGAPDFQVLARAAEDGCVLITADRGDFGKELAGTGATRPSVILFRQLPDVVRASDVAALLIANVTPELTRALDAGAFVVLTSRAIRVRYLPLR